MLAYDYPLLNIFFTTIMLFLWIAWILLLVRVFADIFTSHDIGGFSKALWAIFVLLAPFLGVFIYLIVRGRSMTERNIQSSREAQVAMDNYIRETAGVSTSSADELAKLADLRDRGVIDDTEFAAQKAKLLG